MILWRPQHVSVHSPRGARGAARSQGVDGPVVPGLRGVQQRAAAQAIAQVGIRARAQQHLHQVCAPAQ